ncbi:hypothetical protein K2173_021274 [Erythroxylum novogranatense]|uniref:Uncharacterized protein n=1 Tax=Erythroxylum novogranatense TaxID=1862640 RepID=A0AAV8TUS1_9ROSI|nr:hypothetical protein K2173_021274 [Erythroxylum novogranatense]
MGFGVLRSIVRPLSKTLVSRTLTASQPSFLSPKVKSQFEAAIPRGLLQWPHLSNQYSIFTESSHYDSLTDHRFPKRRPVDKPRRKRASLRPSGPQAWVRYVPGEPIQPNNPNEGSLKRRNEKKRMRLRRAFKLAEAKKRKAQLQEAKRRKNIKRVERKMASVSREREWAQRLAELKQLEEEKRKSMA